MITRTYGTFVVRIWLEPSEGGENAWRASVLNTLTKERAYFSEPEALSAFLTPISHQEEGPPSAP